MAVVAGICTAIACGSPGAHINPAITLAVAILSKNWSNVGPFWIAQILGAFTGAFLVWLVYLPHWKETPDASAKLGVFCTAPAIRNIPANLLCETLVTMLLVIVGFSFGSKELAPAGLAPGFSPWFWGVLVWVLGLSLGGPTGYAINPARDFGPRLAHAVFPLPGKGNSDWGYALVPIMGPLVGGALAAGIVKLAGIA
jgi:glycerol uptake facilitator protein